MSIVPYEHSSVWAELRMGNIWTGVIYAPSGGRSASDSVEPLRTDVPELNVMMVWASLRIFWGKESVCLWPCTVGHNRIVAPTAVVMRESCLILDPPSQIAAPF